MMKTSGAIESKGLRGNSGKRITFIFAQVNCGQRKDGPQKAPEAVVSNDFLATISSIHNVSTVAVQQVYKPSPFDSRLHEPLSVAATSTKLAECVAKTLRQGEFPLVIGGDHSVAIGSVRGVASVHSDVRVMWFDAHADLNIPGSSPSGNMHGMPLAVLLGLTKPAGMEDGRFQCLKRDRIGFVGLRDVDQGEEEAIRQLGLVSTSASDLDKETIGKLTRHILNRINPDNAFPIHLSFDVDGLDPQDAPSTGTPVKGGVRLEMALEMIRIIRQTGCLVSMDLVEVNPDIGTADDVSLTVSSARHVIMEALGVSFHCQAKL